MNLAAPGTTLEHLLRERYTKTDVRALYGALEACGAFDFLPFTSGLYPATPGDAEAGRYRYVWVRDNVHIAHVLFTVGRVREARAVTDALVAYFGKHAHRFDGCIGGTVNADDPMQRPHVRFDGERLEETDEVWPHAQNDAHGYFLWLVGTMSAAGELPVTDVLLHVVSRSIRFLDAVRFETDHDSGHWEEVRAVHASSVGAVCAGLRTIVPMLMPHDPVCVSLAQTMYERGKATLRGLLPYEARDPAVREHDAATLFLVEPLGEVAGEQAATLVAHVYGTLAGEKGVKRYASDAFWGPNYDILASSVRTSNASVDSSFRAEYAVAGREAEWCLFDPLLAIYFDKRYGATGEARAAERRDEQLNRALRALVPCSGGRLCVPELYYWRRGEQVPNTIVPLYWAQANLMRALYELSRPVS